MRNGLTVVDHGRPLKNSTGNGIDKVCQRNFTLRNYNMVL